MKRTTISLSDELASILDREARRRGTSVSEVTRTALLDHFGMSPGSRRRLPFIGIGRSGHRDTAERAEEILAEELSNRIAADRG